MSRTQSLHSNGCQATAIRSNWFEFAIGASLFGGDLGDFDIFGSVGFAPSMFIGYRYQPNTGFFFKVGLAWSMFFGAPVAVGLGSVF